MSAASHAPAPGVPRDYRFPATVRSQTPAGARVVTASMRRLPLVTVTMLLDRGGACGDPAGLEGLARLTAMALHEGTADLDGTALATQLESLGTALGSDADWEASSLSFTVQPQHLDAAVDLARAVILAPAFPERQLTRLRAEHAAERMQLVAEPRSLADAAFTWIAYDADSRFRRPLGGTAATVNALTRDDVARQWAAQRTAAGATVIVVGDIAAERAQRVSQALTDDWAAVPAAERPVRAAPRNTQHRVHLVAKPGAAQSELRLGHPSVPRSHPDYFALTVMNAILGGLFSSRINLNLRERHGYTYGAHSGFDWRRAGSPWLVSTALAADVTGAAIAEVLAEIERIRSSEVSADELSLAASYLVGVFPLRFETTASVAAALAAQATLALEDDYFDTYRERTAAVTPADVLRVANAHLEPDRVQIVVVGDPAALRPQLERGGWGPVAEYGADEIEAAP